MTILHNEIKISAPVEKVWQVLADLEQVQYYNPLVSHTRYISSSKEGVGAMRHCDFKPKGFSKERVFEWKPKEVLGLEIVESSFPMTFSHWRTVLTPVGNETLVSQDLEYEMKFGFLGRLMDALVVRKKYKTSLDGIFEGLKKFVETRK